jgi:hypothetical protein
MVGSERQCCPIRPADTSGANRRPRRAAVGAGPGGPRKGEEDQEVGVPRPSQRGLPDVRAAESLPLASAGELVLR